VLVSATTFAAIGAVAAFLITFFIFDRSGAENLGAGFAFFPLLVIGILGGGFYGMHLAIQLFWPGPALPTAPNEGR
jgi:hypothetical protein